MQNGHLTGKLPKEQGESPGNSHQGKCPECPTKPFHFAVHFLIVWTDFVAILSLLLILSNFSLINSWRRVFFSIVFPVSFVVSPFWLRLGRVRKKTPSVCAGCDIPQHTSGRPLRFTEQFGHFTRATGKGVNRDLQPIQHGDEQVR